MAYPKNLRPAIARWAALFLPEDTASPMRRHHYEKLQTSVLGCIKYWLWIAISIGAAVVIGQL